MVEYLSLTPTEQLYGEKNLLEAQIDAISTIKRLENYKKTRSEELSLKIQLKNKIDEAQNLIVALEKLLPKTRFKDNSKEAEEDLEEKELKTILKRESSPEETAEGQRIDLDLELQAIRRRLSQLR